ncbi:MAG: helix-turn-helix transcriptional regulator, partial [Deltaproteobacteria bacterium]|nr:helix-turn-helix transcriptional regulator [Deltaproteobacteria bacterium]
RLTSREIEILKLLSSGYTYAGIAEKTFVSLNTVKYHMKNIYGKLNISGRNQAIIKAKELGIRPDLS